MVYRVKSLLIRDFGTDWYITAFLAEPYTNSEVSIIGKKITVRLFCKWHILIFILYSSQYLYYYIVVRYIENRLRAVSPFSWSVEQNARDTQMTTHVTEEEAQRLRAHALPSSNLKKKRDCSQSTLKTTRTIIKPPCATTPLKQSSIKNIKIFPVRVSTSCKRPPPVRDCDNL